jgi:hypothetical protein
MSQVEGGDLLVIQRGSESRGTTSSKSGWSDGPWWRDNQIKRDIGIVHGLVEGTKLARASAEAFATEYYASRGGLEKAITQATENLSESNPVRSSDIFLSIQAVGYDAEEAGWFQGVTEEKASSGLVEEKEKDQVVAFAVYLHDPVHAITFRGVSQAIPQKWTEWLDAENIPDTEMQLPEEIVEIVMAGGIDPREWVSEWMEETISLSIGVIAQRYVAKRMGVGEGGLGRGKGRQEAVDAGAGEAARAI